jgi:flagellar protein FliS
LEMAQVAAPTARGRYEQLQVGSASPNKLLFMLYEGAIRFLDEAARHMAARKYEAQSDRIQRTQRILTELASSLDMEVGGELAHSLRTLYAYLHGRLTEANVRSDPALLREVRDSLADLLDTWKEADRACRANTPTRMCA